MKKTFTHCGIQLLLMNLMIFSFSIAQSTSEVSQNVYDCEKQPLGLFRQITGASLKRDWSVKKTILVGKESDVKENRWGLSVLDEIDPAYKFYLIRNPAKSYKEKCSAKMEVVGKLISPIGKVFDFKEATYDIPMRKLSFTTVERDGITYEVEANFYEKPLFINRTFQNGNVKLKASSKTLGIVLMDFALTSWNSE